jgi:hypothetical protein
MTTKRHFLPLIAAAILPAITHGSSCPIYDVLFSSNAYAESIITDDSNYSGAVITTQSDWARFLDGFRPNHEGESLSRSTIDFDEEKVLIATYANPATCLVEIDNTRLECEDDSSMKLFIDVYDASAGCSMKCMAVGQVVYAVAVPNEWEIDAADIVIGATGPCVEVEATATSSTKAIGLKFESAGDLIQFSVRQECGAGECPDPNGTCAVEVSCFANPCEVSSCEAEEECTANYCGGCHAICTPIGGSATTPNPVEVTTISPIFTTVSDLVDNPCGSGACLDPNGTCALEVSCFVDPCEVSSCEAGDECTANYCGGCHAICTPIDGTVTTPIPVDATTLSTQTTNSPLGITCGEGECADPDGICADEIECDADPCLDYICEEGEICMGNTCGGCFPVCVPSADGISFIILDTTTVGTVSGTQEDSTTISATVATGTSTPDIATKPATPTDAELCDQIKVAFESSALSRYLVLDGKGGSSITTVTSQDEMDELLAGFMPTSSESTSELENIDFESEQVIFATYYQSSTCNAELVSASYTCDGTTVQIGMDVIDDSAECEIKCDAEGQVVYALVTPIGADATCDTVVNGECLESPTTDSITLSTTAASEPSTEATDDNPAPAEATDITKSPSSSPSSLSNKVENLPEGIPRQDDSSGNLTSQTHFVFMCSLLVLLHLSWRL